MNIHYFYSNIVKNIVKSLEDLQDRVRYTQAKQGSYMKYQKEYYMECLLEYILDDNKEDELYHRKKEL